MSEIRCVEKIVNLLKSKSVPSEIFWLKDIDQAVDYLESKKSYRGRSRTGSEKLFVVDPRFGLDMCISIYDAFNHANLRTSGHFFILSKHLTDNEKSHLISHGIALMDDSFEIIIGQKSISGDDKLFVC